MQTLSLVGPGVGDVLPDVTDRLDGRVATVERAPPEEADARESGPDGSAAAYTLATDGTWTAAGDGRSFDDLIDALSPRFDYALVAGFSRVRLPTVAVGDVEVRGEVLERVDDATALDPADLATLADEVDPYVTLESLVTEAKASPHSDRSGAIATFTGRVRAKDSPDDDRTTHLEFERYEGVAAERMAAIAAELEAREGVFEVLMHHRTGVVPEGEDIVFVVVLAGHRREAFRTVEDGIDRLKDEVPIFKKESTLEEEFWVHDRT